MVPFEEGDATSHGDKNPYFLNYIFYDSNQSNITDANGRQLKDTIKMELLDFLKTLVDGSPRQLRRANLFLKTLKTPLPLHHLLFLLLLKLPALGVPVLFTH